MNSKKAFTLIELLVVIAIIGILATVSIISLSNARAKSRDAKRVGDMKQIQTALELFFNDNNRYPTVDEFNSGSIFSTSTSGTSTYMQVIPDAPIPADGGCSSLSGYFYQVGAAGTTYTISYCLGAVVGSLGPGAHCASPAGLDTPGNCACKNPIDETGLVAWYEADGNANDSSDNSNNGSLSGTAGFTTGHDGAANSAFSFDGSGASVQVSSLAGYLDEKSALTISLWVNFSAPQVDKNIAGWWWAKQGQISVGAGGVNQNKAYFGLSTDGSPGNVSSASELNDGIWHYVVGVYDGSSAKIYIDGVLDTEYVASGLIDNLDIFNIGNINNRTDSAYAFNGLVDEVKIWSRSLSADEITSEYDSSPFCE